MAQGFVYGGNTVLSNPIFVESILPFLLVFTVVFAVLQKTKILGDKKKQIDAIVALAVGLLVISFGQATGLIIQIVPFLAVSLVVLLVFMILVGSFHKDGDLLGTGMKNFLMVIVFIAVVIAVVYLTGFWQTISDFIFVSNNSTTFVNALFIAIVAGVVIWVLRAKEGGTEGKDK